MIEPKLRDCIECKFWIPVHDWEDSDLGECRKTPPTIVNALVARALKQEYVGVIAFATSYPRTKETGHGCGEWRIRTGEI